MVITRCLVVDYGPGLLQCVCDDPRRFGLALWDGAHMS